jgi:hypothetical protein
MALAEIKRTTTILPPKFSKFFGETAQESFLYSVKSSRFTIDTPEYFYQQPTPEQEKKFKADYDICKGWASKYYVKVPQTIRTYFGKSEYITNEMHARDMWRKYNFTGWKERKDYHVQFEEIRKARRKAYEKLNSLSREEVADLRNKNANTPLQIADLHTGRLFIFSSCE